MTTDTGAVQRARLLALLRRTVDVRPGEVAALLLGFAYFFCLLCSYYALRPLRDAMGLVGGADELQWLFTATFLVMLLMVPAFGTLVARLPPRRFVPLIYRFFTANILVFSALIALEVKEVHVARLFFVWISVFNLFVVSIFWSVLADGFSNEQGRRLFGFIAAGGTAGTFAGPALAAGLVSWLGPVALTLAAAVLLELALQCFFRLGRPVQGVPGTGDRSGLPEEMTVGGRVGGGMFAGVTLILRSPYLLGIVAFMLLHTTAATFLYLEQGRIVASAFGDTAARTRFFATVDLIVSALTLLLQLFLTGRVIRRAGVAGALALLPLAAMLAFATVALWPAPFVLAGAQGLRRAVDYAIARPGREVLFTVVGREAKYKAKSVIETVVYRGGDAVSGWVSAGLTAVGVGFAGMALLAAPLMVGWVALSVWLGRRQDGLARGPGERRSEAAMVDTDSGQEGRRLT